MNYFICNHIKVLYKELHKFDPTFYPEEFWETIRTVEYKCIPMSWTTKWLRVIYVLPANQTKITNRETHQWVIDQASKENGSYYVTDKGYMMQQEKKD